MLTHQQAMDTYYAEFVIESNFSFIATTFLASISLPLSSPQPPKYNVTKFELTSVCAIVGDQTTCNCSSGYAWSNTVCYNYGCCSTSPCNQNVSYNSDLCIPVVKVCIDGLATKNLGTWTPVLDGMLQQNLTQGFKLLNGFLGLNVTKQSDAKAKFTVAVSVIFETTNLTTIISGIEAALNATITNVSTTGLVKILYPQETVNYTTNQNLTCTIKRATESAGWSLTNGIVISAINSGTTANVLFTIETSKPLSQTIVTIAPVTNNWAGTYECSFTDGSIQHTASADLKVALLPDDITITIKPLTIDCTDDIEKTVEVNAIITNSSETYIVKAYLNDNSIKETPILTVNGEQIMYSSNARIPCQPAVKTPFFVNYIFTNTNEQTKSANKSIPVIYDGDRTCPPDGIWPKTPTDTEIRQVCEPGRVGYKNRKCTKTGWMNELSQCISEALFKISSAAANFATGLGATQAGALNIFSGLKNSSLGSDVDGAETRASINILKIMSAASASFSLTDSVLPDVLEASSNILNNSWGSVDHTILNNMSSTYLKSIEELVKNIRINNTEAKKTQNLELKFCRVENNSPCNCTLFDVEVKLNVSSGLVKSMAIKELGHKLANIFTNTEDPNVVLSASLENSTDSMINIQLDFPISKERLQRTDVYCVFWNTTTNQWSTDGCWLRSTKNQTFCECNHLTSFSMLMSKIPLSLPFLDEITYIGLGVSICSLFLFLVIEALVWSAVVKSNLSHFRHTAMVNISLCLLLADCSFLASSFPQILSPSWCLILTVCKHFFFMAMFFWMLCLSFMLVHQVIFVFSPLRKRVYMFISSIMGYICPTLIVGVTYVYYKYTAGDYYDTKTCWLKYESILKGSIHAFLLPVGTIVLMNMFSMVVVILTLVKTSIPEGSKGEEKEMAKSILKAVIFLTPVFGVTWALGFFVLMGSSSNSLTAIVNYSFTIVNSLQGLFILVTGCLAEKRVRDELLKLIMLKVSSSKGKSESMKNLTTANTNSNAH